MEISNFVLVSKTGRGLSDLVMAAEVDVTTGHLWWKKTTREKIQKNSISDWFFIDTGKFTPGYVVDELERSWFAKN